MFHIGMEAGSTLHTAALCVGLTEHADKELCVHLLWCHTGSAAADNGSISQEHYTVQTL